MDGVRVLRQLIALGALLLGAGCNPNRVGGTVDGVKIPVESSMFIENVDAIGEDNLLTVVLSSMPNACDVYESWAARQGGALTSAELGTAWAQSFPSDFWEVTLVIRIADRSVLLGGSMTGVAWDEPLDRADHAFARFTHHTRHRDAAWFDDDAPVEDYLEEYLSDAGLLEFRRGYIPQERLNGRFQTPVVDGQGLGVGIATLRFDSVYCLAVPAFGL